MVQIDRQAWSHSGKAFRRIHRRPLGSNSIWTRSRYARERLCTASVAVAQSLSFHHWAYPQRTLQSIMAGNRHRPLTITPKQTRVFAWLSRQICSPKAQKLHLNTNFLKPRSSPIPSAREIPCTVAYQLFHVVAENAHSLKPWTF